MKVNDELLDDILKSKNRNLSYEDTIEIIKDLSERGYPTYRKAKKIAIEALERQIPKTPLIWENKYYDSPVPNDDWEYECPCCGNRDIDYPEHHCTCGQALDWEFEYGGEL